MMKLGARLWAGREGSDISTVITVRKELDIYLRAFSGLDLSEIDLQCIFANPAWKL